MYFLSSTITSPTLARQWKEVQAAYPKATLVQYDPAVAGTWPFRATQYSLADADVIVSPGCGFPVGCFVPWLPQAGAGVCATAQVAGKLNRLYSIESTPTTTG